MKRKSILVTGGCGYIGSHVTRQLSEAGYRVVVLDNLSTGNSDNLIHGETLIVGDIADQALREELFARFSFEAVMHLAGSSSPSESYDRPLEYYENNTVRSLELIRACAQAGVRFFLFSSAASVYGPTGCRPLPEDYPTNPIDPHSRSKLMTEWMLEDVARSTGMRYVILRYFNVGGADPLGRMGPRSLRSTQLIKVASEAAMGKRAAVTLYGDDYPTPDGTGIRDYIHVEDLASAHVAALRYLEMGKPSETLNCGYGRGYSARQVLDEVARLAGPIPVRQGPRREGDVASLVADVHRIRKILDWHPQYDSLTQIVRSALQWEQKQACGMRLHS